MNEVEVEGSPIVQGTYRFHLYKRDDGTYRSVPEAEPHGLYPVKIQMGRPVFVAEYQSRSNPLDKHQVYRYPDGTLICTCKGNQRWGHCRHVDEEKRKMKENNKQ